jgi:hypothetical protein
VNRVISDGQYEEIDDDDYELFEDDEFENDDEQNDEDDETASSKKRKTEIDEHVTVVKKERSRKNVNNANANQAV